MANDILSLINGRTTYGGPKPKMAGMFKRYI